MDNELPRQELVKCVVVGDSAVGKTRLIVAQATRQPMTRAQLFQTHIPSVWAIDQYRTCQEVLEKSWEVIDGVSVSLRLWDTFGDHDKDRHFAYGRADVVLLCFSTADAISLKNVQRIWLPEIRHFCPRTPIILCGTKNDLRYADLDALIKERGPVSHHCSRHRPFDPKGILPPKEGRQIAEEIGQMYYETSAYSFYGVHEVFDNVIRAALIARSRHRFWQSNLKKVHKPFVQAPYLPPCPDEPHVHIDKSTYEPDIGTLLNDQTCADVTFVVHGELVHCHKVILVAASQVFHDLFMVDLSDQLDSPPSTSSGHPQNQTRIYLSDQLDSPPSTSSEHPQNQSRTYWGPDVSSSLKSDVHMCEMVEDEDEDDHSHHEEELPHTSRPDNTHGVRARLILEDHSLSVSPNGNTCVISSRPSTSWSDVHMEERTHTDLIVESPPVNHVILDVHDYDKGTTPKSLRDTIVPHSIRGLPGKVLNHPAFHSIHLQQIEDPISGKPALRSVVILNQQITASAFRSIIAFLYTGVLDPDKCDSMNDVVRAATLLSLTDLVSMVDNIKHDEEYMNTEIVTHYIDSRRERLSELFAQKGLLSDMVIKVDDGAVMTHKCLLMVRCDPMLAMLCGHFKESSKQEVTMGGFKKTSFKALLIYLYTDQCPTLSLTETIDLIELGNFLCLPRLVTLAEKMLVCDLRVSILKERDVTAQVATLLEPTKLYNAHQLHSWCIHYMSTHYEKIIKNHPKVLKEDIGTDDRILIKSRQWPPSYYHEEAKYYEKQQQQLKKELDLGKKKKWCLK